MYCQFCHLQSECYRPLSILLSLTSIPPKILPGICVPSIDGVYSCGIVDVGALCLSRKRDCRLQLLLAFAIKSFLCPSPSGFKTIYFLYQIRHSLTLKFKFKLIYDRRSVGQSVLVSAPIWSPLPHFDFLSDNCWFLYVGHPLWREDVSVIYSYNCFWALPKQSLLGRSPAELRPYFTVSFEIPPP
jgi:hypothetical protein